MKNIWIILRSLLTLLIITSLILFTSCGEEEEKVPEKTPVVEKPVEVPDTLKPTKEELAQIKKEAAKTGIPEIYEVTEGESLVSIAEKFYNDRLYWFKIFAMNEYQIDDWNKIYPGQKLNLPQSDN